jgi:hypothetical protein
MHLKVKLDDIDDELLFKRVHINYGDKNIYTPMKASYKKAGSTGFNEIYRTFTYKSLDDCIKNESYERSKNQKIKSDLSTDINVLFVDYDGQEVLDDKHIEVLSDIQYSHSDIVVTPTWSPLLRKVKKVDDSVVDKFLDFTNKFIENVETLNSKTILVLIPSKIPRLYLNRLIDNYYSKGITSFVIDFDGKSVTSNESWMRKFYRVIGSGEYKLLEESLIYSLNANEGKFAKEANEILAHDFIGTGYGIDIIGSTNHIRRFFPRPPIPTGGMQEVPKENSLRLFNRDSYGYLRKTETGLRDMGIDNRDQLKARNIREQYEETKVLQSILKDESTIEPYITSKSMVAEKTIGVIKKVRSEAFKK